MSKANEYLIAQVREKCKLHDIEGVIAMYRTSCSNNDIPVELKEAYEGILDTIERESTNATSNKQ